MLILAKKKQAGPKSSCNTLRSCITHFEIFLIDKTCFLSDLNIPAPFYVYSIVGNPTSSLIEFIIFIASVLAQRDLFLLILLFFHKYLYMDMLRDAIRSSKKEKSRFSSSDISRFPRSFPRWDRVRLDKRPTKRMIAGELRAQTSLAVRLFLIVFGWKRLALLDLAPRKGSLRY